MKARPEDADADPLHLQESAVFCVLLAILAIGFGQALTGLDIADQERDATHAVVNTLLQAVLGSPNFDYYDELESSYPFGLILYYAWSVATIVILLNVLVALFSSACEYQSAHGASPTSLTSLSRIQTRIASVRRRSTSTSPAEASKLTLPAVADQSEETWLGYFAGKTVASIRAPDQYLYPAPFNASHHFFSFFPL